jgi:hypothetical protein
MKEGQGMKTIRAAISLLVMAVVVLLASSRTIQAHHAALRFNLEEMVLTADRIFIGTCVTVEATTDTIAQGRLPVTRYTFDVEQVLKGDVPKRFTFTELGHPPGMPAKKGPSVHGLQPTPGLFLHGMSSYAIGSRMMLFLIPNYQNGKLTYPVGLEQGAFLVEDTDREVMVRNNLNNVGLFDAPYNAKTLASGEAKVIFPDASDTIAADAGLTQDARALANRRGALPLAPMLEMVGKIHAAHVKGGR